MAVKTVLFLCVANSARSQMAEGLARAVFPESTTVLSAGSQPTMVNPLAIEVMGELGIDLTRHRSKSVTEIDPGSVDVVITLCADEICPVVPGSVAKHHWPFEDPAAASGGEAERREAFRRVRDQIRERLQAFAADFA